jgi:hypothetical protein
MTRQVNIGLIFLDVHTGTTIFDEFQVGVCVSLNFLITQNQFDGFTF